MAIVDMAEEDLLMGSEFEIGDKVMTVDGIDFLGCLGDNDDTGPAAGRAELAQVAIGHDMVAEIGLAIFRQEDIDGRLDGAMLEDIVKKDDLRRGLAIQQPTDTLDTLLAYCHSDLGILIRNHGRLVAQTGRAVATVVKDKASGLAAVAATEQRRLVLGREQTKKIFNMRSFPGASGTQVPHADGGDRRCHLTFDAKRVHQVAEPHPYGIPHGKREQNTRYRFTK
jgi:hypothetical protein